MPSFPGHMIGSSTKETNSIRSTVSLGKPAPFASGIVVCVGSDGVLRPYGKRKSSDPILGVVERIHAPMNTEVDVVHHGIVHLEFLENGKTYYLQDDGSLATKGHLPLIRGIGEGKGIFSIPHEGVGAGVPTGTMMQIWSDVIPLGWLECDGSLISAKKHPALFDSTRSLRGSIRLSVITGSHSMLSLSYNGTITEGTILTIPLHGSVQVLSCKDGMLVVTSDKEFSWLSCAPNAKHELVCNDPNWFFLPIRQEPPYKWIVKT